MLYGGKTFGVEQYAITSAVLEDYARSARDPRLAAELRERVPAQRALEEAQKVAAAQAAEAYRKRQEEWKKQGNPGRPLLSSGHVYTAPASASFLYSSAPLGGAALARAEAFSSYMKDIGSYIHGNSVWKPVYRY